MGWVKDKGSTPQFKEGGKVKYQKGGTVQKVIEGESGEKWEDKYNPYESGIGQYQTGPHSKETSEERRLRVNRIKKIERDMEWTAGGTRPPFSSVWSGSKDRENRVQEARDYVTSKYRNRYKNLKLQKEYDESEEGKKERDKKYGKMPKNIKDANK